MTAIPASLQDPEETRLAQCLDIGRRYFTQLFSLGHEPAQFRNEGGGTRHKIIMSKRLVCNARGYRAFTLRGGDGHGGASCCSWRGYFPQPCVRARQRLRAALVEGAPTTCSRPAAPRRGIRRNRCVQSLRVRNDRGK